MQREYKCGICGQKEKGFGHNGEPIAYDRVCDVCNMSIVIPKRIQDAEDAVAKVCGTPKKRTDEY